jgi:hypothetical protein
MTSRCGTAAAVVFSLVSALAAVGVTACSQADLVATQYYVSPLLGVAAIPLVTVTERAQSSGYATILRHGADVVAFRGGKRTDETEETLLGASSLLYVDGEFVLVRVTGPDLDYVVRPGELGYDLLLIPHHDLALGQSLPPVLTELQRLGVLGAGLNLAFTPFPQAPEKTPPAPQGARLDSLLYGLVLSDDWFSYSTKTGLARVGLRVEVVAEKVAGATLPEAYRTYVTEETEQLAKLLLPIHLLVGLASTEGVSYVRPPYQPVPAVQ